VLVIFHNKRRLWHQLSPRNKFEYVKYTSFTGKLFECRTGLAHTEGLETSLRSNQRFDSYCYVYRRYFRDILVVLLLFLMANETRRTCVVGLPPMFLGTRILKGRSRLFPQVSPWVSKGRCFVFCVLCLLEMLIKLLSIYM
jgi:hypothetical protein